jgi:large subunit ribosomal protein L22
MESKAIARHVHQSPRKIRKTLNSVRGLNVSDALSYLRFSPEKASAVIEKTVRSALANYSIQVDESNVDPGLLSLKEAYVDGGPVMKRFRAASMGRASRLRRPTSHITIVLADKK